MTKDLEETLSELGPGYRSVVDRLVAAYEPPAPFAAGGSAPEVRRVKFGRSALWSVGYLAAASLMVFAAIGVVFRAQRTEEGRAPSHRVYTAAYVLDDASRAAILASQRADGSWENDFVTCQNAAALRGGASVEMRIGYKKAVRYLRSRGLKPLSDAELKMRGNAAARMLTRA